MNSEKLIIHTFIMTLLLTLGIIYLLPVEETSGDTTNYEKIDQVALSTPKSAERSLKHLAQYLLSYANTDKEKARAAYRWITHNITYDAEAYFLGRVRDTNIDPEDVFMNRLTVCDGYARLFEELGFLMGMVVVRVEGYVNSNTYGLNIQGGPPNHAWNAVRIDSQWQLVDSTWGAGYIDSSTRIFVRQFDNRYFLPPPEQFILTHFPFDPKWQCLQKPLSVRAYLEQIDRKSLFDK